jgi:hypothetical protein
MNYAELLYRIILSMLTSVEVLLVTDSNLLAYFTLGFLAFYASIDLIIVPYEAYLYSLELDDYEDDVQRYNK